MMLLSADIMFKAVVLQILLLSIGFQWVNVLRLCVMRNTG